MLSGEGCGKFGVLDFGFETDGLDFLIGINSCRCWRETDIWRAMEMSAADLRRSSRSASSGVRVLEMGFGTVDDFDGVDSLDVERLGEPKAALDTSAGRGRLAEDVVALRFRLVAGGD